MHYTGMAAFEIQGRIVWDPALVTASIVLGGLFGGAALAAGLRGDTIKWRIYGALLLTLAICSHHFTAMGAVSIIPDPTIAAPYRAADELACDRRRAGELRDHSPGSCRAGTRHS